MFSESPYPYFVRDDYLQGSLLMDMRRNWPGEGYWVMEIPGNYICEMTKFLGSGFWKEFTKAITPGIVGDSLAEFAELIEARYPGEKEFYVVVNSLMQARGDYGGHDVHTHHYHDPCFVATVLIYVDADSDGHSGTTVLKTKEGLDEAYVAAQTLGWHDFTEDHETVDYKHRRLFAIYDNAIGYHRVKPSLPPARFGRRILRLHIAAHDDHCKRIYGVDRAEYQRLRLNPTKDKRVVEWMRKDIDAMRSTKRTLTPQERNAWRMNLQVGIKHPDPETCQ